MEKPINYLAQFGCEILKSISAVNRSINKENYSSIVVITDENVCGFLESELQGLGQEILVLPAGEKTKTLAYAEHCWEKMVEMGCDRKSLVIGVGGGVVSDLAGFVGACYMRGVDTLYIPTTMMGMVDAAIGGKTAVNLAMGKNLVGAFHHPVKVLIVPQLLQTLGEREFRSGIAEVIKYGVIFDENFFSYLEENMEKILERDVDYVVRRSCEIKTEIVARDEKEKDIRSILNFGHSFAHAIEAVTGYGKFLHGEAVAMGMCMAMELSWLMGKVGQGEVERVENLCKKAHLPTEFTEASADQLIGFMKADKKNVFGKFSLIVAEKIGKVVKIADVEKDLIRQVWEKKHS